MKRVKIKTDFLLLITAGISIGLYSCNSHTKKTYKDPLDLSARDTTVSPAQNFFEYANGTWLKKTKIPADKKGWGSFFTIEEKVNNQIKTILDSCAALKNPSQGSPAQQLGALYACAMDSVAIDKAGLAPLQADLDQIQEIKNAGDIVYEIAREYKNGDWTWDWYDMMYTYFNMGALCTFYVYNDDKNSNVTRFQCNQGGLGLPNKTYYFKTDSTSQSIIRAYKNYIARILRLTGDSVRADTDAVAIFSLEKKLAQASKTPVQLRDPQTNYHLMSLSEMNRLTPNIHWNELLHKMGVHADTLLVGQPEYYKSLSALLVSEPIHVWKNYLTFHLLSRFSPWSSKSFVDANFDFYGTKLNGQQKQQSRWKRVAKLADATLGDDLGRLYVKQFFPPASKDYMMHLVDNLKAAFKEHIENLTWMSDSTKAKALDKLNAIVKKIGYPDHWKDYSTIRIDSHSVIANLKRIGQWYYQYDMDKLHKPVDRSEWLMTPATVNAYYNPFMNDINFPAGILQPPFYFQHGDDAVNYGGIGFIIGHEMTHGFDDQGSQFDKYGNLKSWWTKEDRIKFEKLAARIVKQYDNYTVLDSVHVNGRLTEGENIADNGGMAIAYTAFQNTPEAHKDTLIDGLTPDQRFFMSAAQVWRTKVRPQTRLTWINSDTHSPEMYRVIGPMSNMPSFYKAFSVKPGDKMYRPDSVRVNIW